MKPNQAVHINLENARPIVCKKCNSPYFITAMKVRRLSALASLDGQEHVVPIPTLVCLHCHLEIGSEKEEIQ